jgi:hypothetical protein
MMWHNILFTTWVCRAATLSGSDFLIKPAQEPVYCFP